MDLSNHQDMLSDLTDVLLIIIISFLPFKEAVCTSVLSKRWRKLCHETRNISFKEAEYVDHFALDDVSRKDSFVRYVDKWLARFEGASIESFELCLSMPVDYLAEIDFIINFVVSRKVKNLVLDFADPTWKSCDEASLADISFQLPSCFYRLSTTLESLKLSCCGFVPSRLGTMGLLRRLSLAWMGLPQKLEDLLPNTLLLESLILNCCWDLGTPNLDGDMREIVLEDCNIEFIDCAFKLPREEMFKYSGLLPSPYAKTSEDLKDVRTRTQEEEDSLTCYLNRFRTKKTLCIGTPVLLGIQESMNHRYLVHPVQAEHLIMKTKLHAKEFKGIKLMLDNCQKLEKFTLDILSPTAPYPMVGKYGGINPQTYWLDDELYENFPKRLKVLVVKNFGGSINELHFLQFLIRAVYGPSPMLEILELYMPGNLDFIQRMRTVAAANMLQGIAPIVQVKLYEA